jgi:hypothetical protein
MALPESKTAWPPASHTARYSRMGVCSIWYGGDPAQLSALYGGGKAEVRTRGWGQSIRDWFWGKSDPTQPDDKIHIGIAQQIATLSSELLFSEPLGWEVQPVIADGEEEPSEEALKDAAKTQSRLDEILDAIGWDAILLAAGETGAALGSVGLRIAYDRRVPGISSPRISRVDADHIIPEYSFGMLTAVTFWEIVKKRGEALWFHLERHESGRVYHGLYAGTEGNLGQQVPLTDADATAHLAPLVNEEGFIPTGVDGLLGVSIPNMLPDPLDRAGETGRSDYTPAVITQFDAIDRTATSLMRDVEDGRSRLLIADYMLETRGAGKGVGFDQDQHLFTKIRRAPSESGDDAPIDQVQFRIRVQEHLETIEWLTKEALKEAGYNTDSEMGEGGGEMTATEYRGRAKRSLATRDKKLHYWRVLEGLLTTLLELDAANFGSGITPLPVKMVIPESVQPSLAELAATAKALREAQAASIETVVKMIHPDWDQEQIDAEIEAILGEGEADPTTLGLPPATPAPEAEEEAEEPPIPVAEP